MTGTMMLRSLHDTDLSPSPTLGQSPAMGGGCVINTGAVRTWLELSSPLLIAWA